MNPKLLLGLALVLSGEWYCHHAQAQSASSTNAWHGFPVIPAITNANPAIRHPVSIQVPTELKIERTDDTLSVTVATNRETVSIEVGTNMVVGFRSRLFVYPVGITRPANYSDSVEGGGFVFGAGTIFLHTKPDGIPQKGKSYVVEMELSAFETDIPPQHDWSPHSRNYKVLWQRTLKRTVEYAPVAGQTDASSSFRPALTGCSFAPANQEASKITKARVLAILDSMDQALVKKDADLVVANFASNAVITAAVFERQHTDTTTNDTSSYRSILEAGFKRFDDYQLQRKDVIVRISPDGRKATSLSTLIETYRFAGNAERAVTKETATFESVGGKIRLTKMDSSVKVTME